MYFAIESEELDELIKLNTEKEATAKKALEDYKTKHGLKFDNVYLGWRTHTILAIGPLDSAPSKDWKEEKKLYRMYSPKRNSKVGKALAQELKDIGQVDINYGDKWSYDFFGHDMIIHNMASHFAVPWISEHGKVIIMKDVVYDKITKNKDKLREITYSEAKAIVDPNGEIDE